MHLATMVVILGTVAVPRAGAAERVNYVDYLCRYAVSQVRAEPGRTRNAHSLERRREAQDAFSVCLYAFGSMRDAWHLPHICAHVVRRLRPEYPDYAGRVCEQARQSAIDWSSGRF